MTELTTLDHLIEHLGIETLTPDLIRRADVDQIAATVWDEAVGWLDHQHRILLGDANVPQHSPFNPYKLIADADGQVRTDPAPAARDEASTKAGPDADAVTPAGWLFPTMMARKCHYFPEGEFRSLCGKYGRFRSDPGSPDKGTSRDDCRACRRKLDTTR